MREQLELRLEGLKKEFATGRARAAELEKQQAMLHDTLLRISGAIQVIEEELAKENGMSGNGIGEPDPQGAHAMAGSLAEGDK